MARLSATALNWHDTLTRQRVYGSPLPAVIGAGAARTVVDSGEKVVILPSLFWGSREAAPSAGFEILGDHRGGTYAELVAVPDECVFPRPAGMSVHEAAAFPLVGVTAYRALLTRGRLAAGESILILGASGGVATMAVPLASAVGARATVASTSQAKIDRARELGAVAGVDHSARDWVERARALTPGKEGFGLFS